MMIKRCDDWQGLYEFLLPLMLDIGFEPSFTQWQESLLNDIDGNGNRLFQALETTVAYQHNRICGVIQYGFTAMGFDDQGILTSHLSLPVIRFLYFASQDIDVGQALLDQVNSYFYQEERRYAFYHYFGLSCLARHGKLFSNYPWIETLLKQNAFQIEHENIYYSRGLKVPCPNPKAGISISWATKTAGNQQQGIFLLDQQEIGEFELHFLEENHLVYLLWIGITEKKQNQGFGTDCLRLLLKELRALGYQRIDTDTAIHNHQAKHFYEKNGFKQQSITKSFFQTLTNQ